MHTTDIDDDFINDLMGYDKGTPKTSMGRVPVSPWMVEVNDLYALTARGISMEPRIYTGDTLFVHKQSDARSGQVVVCKVDGKPICKRYRKVTDGVWLEPDNPNGDFKARFFPYSDKENLPQIFGVVVEIRSTHI